MEEQSERELDAQMTEVFRKSRSQDHGHHAIAYAIMRLAESIRALGAGMTEKGGKNG